MSLFPTKGAGSQTGSGWVDVLWGAGGNFSPFMVLKTRTAPPGGWLAAQQPYDLVAGKKILSTPLPTESLFFFFYSTAIISDSFIILPVICIHCVIIYIIIIEYYYEVLLYDA